MSSYSSVTLRLLSPSFSEGLNVDTGIPIVYPRMAFLESMLSSKFNPLVTLGKSSFKGFVNKYNGDAELLDDLVLISFPPCLRSKLNFLFQERSLDVQTQYGPHFLHFYP